MGATNQAGHVRNILFYLMVEYLECYIETKPNPHYEEATVGQENKVGVTEGR